MDELNERSYLDRQTSRNGGKKAESFSMALDYSLSLEQNRACPELLSVVSSLPNFSAEDGELRAPGLTIKIGRAAGLSAEVIRAGFGFVPKVYISFRLDKFEDRQRTLERMISAVNALLRQTQGDAVMLFNGETVILQRTAGQLQLCRDEIFWAPRRLALLDVPHSFANYATH